jgi:uncharacterized protein Usg
MGWFAPWWPCFIVIVFAPLASASIAFWQAKLEGLLYKVTVCHNALVGPRDLQAVGREFRLN